MVAKLRTSTAMKMTATMKSFILWTSDRQATSWTTKCTISCTCSARRTTNHDHFTHFTSTGSALCSPVCVSLLSSILATPVPRSTSRTSTPPKVSSRSPILRKKLARAYSALFRPTLVETSAEWHPLPCPSSKRRPPATMSTKRICGPRPVPLTLLCGAAARTIRHRKFISLPSVVLSTASILFTCMSITEIPAQS